MTVSVYKLVVESNRYQSIVPENDDAKWGAGGLEFAGKQLGDVWRSPGFRIYDPEIERGDFLGIGPGAIAVSLPTPEQFLSMYEIAGELLPVGENLPELFILNVTSAADCLNYDQSDWVRGKSGSAIRARKLAFKKQLIPKSSIFKIVTRPHHPQYVKTTLFTHVGIGDHENDFKYQVEQHGLRGLRFEHMWTSEK